MGVGSEGQGGASNVKGVSSKPSGKYSLFFNFAELCKVSVRLDNIDIRYFIRVPPFEFLVG